MPALTLGGDCSNLKSITWILGQWQQDSENSITTETWTKLSPNTFDGISQILSKKDDKITFVETLRIVEMSKEVFYIAKVSHNAFPVSFKLTECSDSMAVFENADHDFPKKLVYKIEDDGRHLNVTVSNEERQFTVEYIKPGKN